MKKKNNNPNERGSWIKVILGFILMSWNILNRKKNMEERQKTSEREKPSEEKKFHEKEIISTISANNQRKEDADKEREGWLKAQPEKLPAPTYWPFFLALGLTFLFWGIITSWVIIVVGLLIFIIALAGWINILRHEK